MKSKRKKYGIFLLFLIVLIPLSIYFSHSGVNNDHQRDATQAPKKQINTSASSVKDGKKSHPVNQGNKAPENTNSALTATAPVENKTAQRPFLVVIDPGHQIRANTEQESIGPGASETKMKVTSGTSGVATGKPEYKLTWEASLILGQLLESKGAKVIYTRTTNDVNLSNRERAEIANQNKADLFVRIHADGSTDRNVHGLSVLTPSSNDLYTKSIFENSLKASQLIINETNKNSAVKVNGISYRSDMAGFNWSKVPCTLVELGFMTNPTEDKNLSNPTYLKNLLTNIAEGIMQYADNKS